MVTSMDLVCAKEDPNEPKLTYLFFADDSLLFYKANSKECSKVLELLSLYEEVFGQKLNREKTTLFFSKAVTEANRQIIKGNLGVREIHHYEKYLGLPSLTRRGKKQVSTILKRECGGSCKDGKESSFPKSEERCSLWRSSKPYLRMQWVSSNYLWGCAMKLGWWLGSFGGDNEGRNERFIG